MRKTQCPASWMLLSDADNSEEELRWHYHIQQSQQACADENHSAEYILYDHYGASFIFCIVKPILSYAMPFIPYNRVVCCYNRFRENHVLQGANQLAVSIRRRPTMRLWTLPTILDIVVVQVDYVMKQKS
eukprot:scaffold1833_cov185-Ochromonas_danica.AAC.8